MADRAVAVAAGGLALLVLLKAPGTLRRGAASARGILVTFALLSAGFAAFVPTVVQWFAQTSGLSHINQPLARTFLVLALVCGHSSLRLAADPAYRPRVRGLAGDAALTVAVLWTCFGLSPGEGVRDFGSDLGRDASAATFMVTFLAYAAGALVAIIRTAWRLGSQSRGCLRWGLRLIALGSGCCIGYVGAKLLELLGYVIAAPMPAGLDKTVPRSLAAVGAVLVAAGAAAVPLGQRVAAFVAWLSDLRCCWRLYPMWADLAGVVPAFALNPPIGRLRDALRPRHAHERLYRRLVELRDFWMELRPYFSADLARQAARQRRGTDCDADVSAVVLWWAAQARRARREPAAVWTAPAPTHATMAEELGWWLAVAQCWESGTSGSSRSIVEPGMVAR